MRRWVTEEPVAHSRPHHLWGSSVPSPFCSHKTLCSFSLPASCLRRMLDQVSTPEGLQEGLNTPYTLYPTPSPAYSQLTNFCISVTWVSVGGARAA